MEGIVSLLDVKHYHLVEDLWAELAREFGVRGVYITPYPHFSYHVAAHYDIESLTPIIDRITSNITTFQVRTSGLGIFTGEAPIIYIPVVRSLELTQLHEALWEEISPTASGAQEYYHPTQWMPHITIGFGDINKGNLPPIVRWLNGRDFNWEITVNNITFIQDTGTEQVLKARFEIRNEPVPGESSMKRLHRRRLTHETLQGILEVREQIRQHTNGCVFEDSSELIRQQREERTRQLMREEE
ncbi:MAG TPA: 2'-5' RNA ligase family protein [Ktedonobacteraceae bacterium]